ncbi:DUF6115 domain-containing protein [Paenibacillus piri]|nr:hypothetical protein [Paenibacillus piri]
MPKKNETKGQSSPALHEIEETMEHFTAELEEQNQALIQLLAETKRDYELQTARLAARIELLEKQSGQSVQEIIKLSAAAEELQKQSAKLRETAAAAAEPVPEAVLPAAQPEAASAGEPEEELVSHTAPMNMKARYSELFALYDQGKSTDYIARKLSMNKGEVSLIIQLAKQEERLHAH